jgi:hypothetical protein
MKEGLWGNRNGPEVENRKRPENNRFYPKIFTYILIYQYYTIIISTKILQILQNISISIRIRMGKFMPKIDT